MSRLTVLKCKAALKPGMYGDGGTLYLDVAPGGSRSWIQRLVIGGQAEGHRPWRVSAGVSGGSAGDGV